MFNKILFVFVLLFPALAASEEVWVNIYYYHPNGVVEIESSIGRVYKTDLDRLAHDGDGPKFIHLKDTKTTDVGDKIVDITNYRIVGGQYLDTAQIYLSVNNIVAIYLLKPEVQDRLNASHKAN